MSGYPQNQTYQPPQQYTTQHLVTSTSQPYIQPQQPIVSQPVITVNQVSPVNLEGALRSQPAFVVCPYCRQGSVTRVETQCSILNCCCCFCTGLIPWLCFQACRSKDINCTDAQHFCTACGAKIYSYQAC
jgi:hypothetical protein